MKLIIIKILFKALILTILYLTASYMNFLFIGALIFFISGYYYSPIGKPIRVILDIFIPIIVFIAFLIGDNYISGVSREWDKLFSYTGYCFVVFGVSYFLAFSIKYFIKNTFLKKIVFFALLSILIYRVSIFISHPFAAVVLGIVIFIFSFLLFRDSNSKKWFVFATFTIPYASLYLFIGDMFDVTIIIFVYLLANLFLSYIISLYYNEKQISRFITKAILLGLVIFQITFYIFILNWSEFIFTKSTVLPNNLEFSEKFYDNENQQINNEVFNDKIVVLSLWTSSCKYCFENFPDLQKLYLKYQNDIVIIAVGLPFDHQNISDLDTLITKYNYEFPIIYSDKNLNYYNDRYNIQSVPAAIILNKNGRIIFNNNYNTNTLLWVNNIDRIIAKELEVNSNQ